MTEYKKQYEGQVYNCVGGRATVLSYHNAKKVLIRFDDGYETIVQMGNLKRGACDNPFRKTVYGVGYNGVGMYSLKSHPLAYKKWAHMMYRCYGEEYTKKKPTYIDCSVCDEWHNFQNFAQWFEENHFKGSDIELDKDILVKGNKIYSPKTCCLVPREINSLFQKKGEDNGLPNGVQQISKDKYRARYGQVHLGVFDNLAEASNVYEKYRSARIKELVVKYQDILKPEVSQAILDSLEGEKNEQR